MREGWANGKTTFDYHCKSMKIWARVNKLVLCSGYNAPTLFRNLQKMLLTYKECVTLYVLRPGFPIEMASIFTILAALNPWKPFTSTQ